MWRLVAPAALFASLSLGAPAHGAEQTPPAPDSLAGTYEGTMTMMTKGGSERDYRYGVEVSRVDAKAGTLSVRTHCPDCKTQDSPWHSCRFGAAPTPVTFVCKGNGWHQDFVAEGTALKADCHSIDGRPYFIRVRKAGPKAE